MRLIKLVMLQILFVLIFYQNSFATEDIKNSIVKIYTQSIKPYYTDPWTMDSPEGKSGSGSIIEGKRILTNAHVVSDHTIILVRKYGEAKKYKAKLEFISNEADLAILKIIDESFFDGTKPIQIGELPKTQEEVVVYGYPKGGDTLSTTKGVISRIEHEIYAQSTLSFLASQIDASINPGNSGGPAIVNNEVVGIVMQSLGSSENIGYMVPTPIIKHFLDDIYDGKYDGYPGLGVITQNIENNDQKRKYGMNEKDEGVLVVKVIPGSSADGIINEKDIL
ncbi:MAG: S1C family serine protease, partial [Thermodesulfobacteriota bacterium]